VTLRESCAPGSSPTALHEESSRRPIPPPPVARSSDATARFHNPTHAPEWSNPGIDAAYERVRTLVLDGLTPRRSRQA
jgi:hypothetical protein